MADSFRRLSSLEAMLALPFGVPDVGRSALGVVQPAWDRSPTSAREAFTQVVAEAYVDASSPPYVLFSGGRDSSAVLAVATDYARRTDRPDPVPVIVRHLDDPAADETSWQELVLQHLHLDDPVVLTFRDDQRLLGSPARESLQLRGPIWPAAVTLHSAIYRQLRPAYLLTGEGGDHTMLPQRITELRNGLHYRRPAQVVAGLAQLAVGALGQRHLEAELPSWLTPDGVRQTREALRPSVRPPNRFDHAILALFGTVYDGVLLHNFAAMAAAYGLTPVHPFIDLRFRAAWARAGGALGFAGRNDNMKRLFADLLPESILVRSTKADFTASRWGADERGFAADWDGRGVDPGLINAELLRADWMSAQPHPFAEYLLHHVWATSCAAATVWTEAGRSA